MAVAAGRMAAPPLAHARTPGPHGPWTERDGGPGRGGRGGHVVDCAGAAQLHSKLGRRQVWARRAHAAAGRSSRTKTTMARPTTKKEMMEAMASRWSPVAWMMVV